MHLLNPLTATASWIFLCFSFASGQLRTNLHQSTFLFFPPDRRCGFENAQPHEMAESNLRRRSRRVDTSINPQSAECPIEVDIRLDRTLGDIQSVIFLFCISYLLLTRFNLSLASWGLVMHYLFFFCVPLFQLSRTVLNWKRSPTEKVGPNRRRRAHINEMRGLFLLQFTAVINQDCDDPSSSK